MNTNSSIRLKAALLVLVFGLNTVVGFACAIGLNMGFNAHHHEEEGTEIAMDAPAKHHPDEMAEHHHHKQGDSKKDDCCKDKVVKLSQEDKAIPSSNTNSHPVFLTVFLPYFTTAAVLFTSQVITSSNYFARNYHPPIPDIRIAIRSFQI